MSRADVTGPYEPPAGPAYDFLAPPQAADEIGRLGPYRVLEVLGAGGMGVVFRAEDPRLRRPVALKAMLPGLAAGEDARRRFLREARAAAAISHDHVVTVYEVGEDRGVPFLAMQYLEGETLDARLRRDGRLPAGEVVRVGREVALGLAAAHGRGLIHRDVKPANVWLEASPGREPGECRAKVLDFGLARPSAADDGLTQQGAVLGTPAYMAPEQAQGGPVDGRSDLFSLGCVLYRMATGEPAFQGADVISTLMAVALHAPPPPHEVAADVPPGLSALIVRLLEKDPARRPASAEEVADALARVGRPVPPPPPVARPAATPFDGLDAPRPRKRAAPRWPLGVAVALVMLALLGTWLTVAVLLRVETADGTLIVELDGADVEARVKGGTLILTGADGKELYRLKPRAGGSKVDPGAYTIRVEGANGVGLDTREFTMKKGGRFTVRVTLEAKPPPPPPVVPPDSRHESDRKAAEYVLLIGGVVRVNGEVDDVRKAEELPGEPFRLTYVNLTRNPNVRNAGLAAFAGCRDVRELYLTGTQVKDLGLSYFKDCRDLTHVDLGGVPVTDDGFVHLREAKKLQFLVVYDSQLGDRGLANFKGCDDLKYLVLQNTKVTDSGLAVFKGCTTIEHLNLCGSGLSDRGLANFRGCSNLTFFDMRDSPVTGSALKDFKDLSKLIHVNLDDTRADDRTLELLKGCTNLVGIHLYQTRVTDKGILILKECKQLRALRVPWTAVTDEGLRHVEEYKALVQLDLRSTKVTKGRVEALRAAMPLCRIEAD